MSMNDLFIMLLDIVTTNNISIIIAFVALLIVIICVLKD